MAPATVARACAGSPGVARIGRPRWSSTTSTGSGLARLTSDPAASASAAPGRTRPTPHRAAGRDAPQLATRAGVSRSSLAFAEPRQLVGIQRRASQRPSCGTRGGSRAQHLAEAGEIVRRQRQPLQLLVEPADHIRQTRLARPRLAPRHVAEHGLPLAAYRQF